MDLSEKMVSSQTIFDGKIIKVTLDQAQLPDGTLAAREVVYHPGGVAVLALDEDKTVYLVRQYRYPIQQLLLELPAGKLDHGAEEDPVLGAQRELSEETGLEAAEWTYLGYTLASPGFCALAHHPVHQPDARKHKHAKTQNCRRTAAQPPCRLLPNPSALFLHLFLPPCETQPVPLSHTG